MKELVDEIISNVNEDVIGAVTSKFGLDNNIASNLLPTILPNMIETIKSNDIQEFMPLIGKLAGGDKPENIDELKEMPIIQKVLESTQGSIMENFNLDSLMSNNLTKTVLPFVLSFINKKYGKNPLSLLGLLSNSNSGSLGNIASVANKLGGLFGK